MPMLSENDVAALRAWNEKRTVNYLTNWRQRWVETNAARAHNRVVNSAQKWEEAVFKSHDLRKSQKEFEKEAEQAERFLDYFETSMRFLLSLAHSTAAVMQHNEEDLRKAREGKLEPLKFTDDEHAKDVRVGRRLFQDLQTVQSMCNVTLRELPTK